MKDAKKIKDFNAGNNEMVTTRTEDHTGNGVMTLVSVWRMSARTMTQSCEQKRSGQNCYDCFTHRGTEPKVIDHDDDEYDPHGLVINTYHSIMTFKDQENNVYSTNQKLWLLIRINVTILKYTKISKAKQRSLEIRIRPQQDLERVLPLPFCVAFLRDLRLRTFQEA